MRRRLSGMRLIRIALPLNNQNMMRNRTKNRNMQKSLKKIVKWKFLNV